MGITVHRGFFRSRDEVLDDIKANGFWPTTYVSTPSPTVPVHWHDSEVHGYVIEGKAWVLDGETGDRVDLAAGDKLVLPAGTLHAEGESRERVVFIVALPEAVPFDQFLRMHEPEERGRR